MCYVCSGKQHNQEAINISEEGECNESGIQEKL